MNSTVDVSRILRYHLTKSAAAPVGPMLSRLARVANVVGVGAAIVAGAGAAAKGGEFLYSKFTSTPRFNQMLKENPDIKPGKHSRQMFDIVHQMSPDLTKHPVVAGSFVRKALEYKDVGVSPASVKELVDINLGIAKARGEKGQLPGALRNLALMGAVSK